MKFLFIFLDGVGLGANDPDTNPFALAELPNLTDLLEGNRLVADTLQGYANTSRNSPRDKDRPPGDLVVDYQSLETERASLLALDARLSVEGLPQSATGQATLLSGQNVPVKLGYHYGPKPNPPVADFLKNGNIFSELKKTGREADFINAYPPSYFEGIESGHRLYAAIPLAATSAGIRLKTDEDLYSGQAIAADFTAQGWHTHLGLMQTPVLTPQQAGERLVQFTNDIDFAFFEYWLSDIAGHRQDMNLAVSLLETFDQVLGGLLNSWDDSRGLILITSDHGNMEDLSTRRHTYNHVPALLIGAPYYRREFATGLQNLSEVAPAVSNLFTHH